MMPSASPNGNQGSTRRSRGGLIEACIGKADFVKAITTPVEEGPHEHCIGHRDVRGRRNRELCGLEDLIGIRARTSCI